MKAFVIELARALQTNLGMEGAVRIAGLGKAESKTENAGIRQGECWHWGESGRRSLQQHWQLQLQGTGHVRDYQGEAD